MCETNSLTRRWLWSLPDFAGDAGPLGEMRLMFHDPADGVRRRGARLVVRAGYQLNGRRHRVVYVKYDVIQELFRGEHDREVFAVLFRPYRENSRVEGMCFYFRNIFYINRFISANGRDLFTYFRILLKCISMFLLKPKIKNNCLTSIQIPVVLGANSCCVHVIFPINEQCFNNDHHKYTQK